MEELGLNFNFSGRKVLVTGGASGIGKVTAKTFLKLGASVIVVDVNRECLEALKSEDPEITVVCADIGDWNGLEAALSPHHPIHHLVNNAGVLGGDTSLSALTEEDLDKTMNINFKAAVRISQLISRGMIEAKLEGATIVNISSIESGRRSAMTKTMIYGASKAALLAVSRTMAHELAPHKIRVNAVRPGGVETEMVKLMDPELKQLLLGPVLKRQVYHQDLIKPQQIANTVVYLSSPASEMVTGTDITVDAGYELY